VTRLACGATAVLLAAALAACSSGPPDYGAALLAARAAKDTRFRSAENSPIPADRRGELLPLRYFPPDETYRVPAALRSDPGRAERLMMLTSTGQQRAMARVGVLEFTVKGRALTLGAFVEANEPENLNRLFVPFTDLTSGTETYGGGRYLELDRTPTGIYNVDFNLAFNPYCFYNTTYDCPYPPAENRLSVAVRAGERGR
jgi:uncharacterized protein